MAWSILPEPGTEYGPCAETCAHTDCAATRQMAGLICPFCGEPLGYGKAIWNIESPAASTTAGERQLAHVGCTWLHRDRQQGQQQHVGRDAGGGGCHG